MMNYHLGQGPDRNWLVAETEFDSRYQGKCEAIFSQGNGYLGQRATLEENYVGRTPDLLVTGTFDDFDGREVTELPNLPDMTELKIRVDGHPFSMLEGKTEKYVRTLNLHTGELERTLVWQSPLGKKLAFRFTRFVSMARKHVLGLCMEVGALNGDVELSVESGINGQVTNEGSQHFHEGTKRLYDLRILRMTSETLHSGVTCCQFAGSRYWVDGEEGKENGLPVIGRRTISSRASFCLKQGQTLRMEKLCTVYTSRDARWENEAFSVEKLEEEGMNALREAEALGYDHLFAESADAWKQLWQEIDIQIDSENEFDQLAIRFAQYHMNSFILKNDNRVGIGAKGLSGEGYKGHSFWDTEIFVFPYFLLTQPKAARTLLEYRYNTLAGARKKAAENGCEGAMYPWESAWKDDGEVTPLWGAADVVTGKPTKIWTGILELHITADIAFAVKQYFRATGDQDFLDRYGYEIVVDAARFWASRAEWKPEHDRYEYTDVIGPDEYKEHVDNNAYTNYMAAYNMRTALEMMAELEARGDSVYERLNGQLDFAASAAKIRKVLDKLYLPRESADGILPQFDGYFDLTHIDLTKYKQASVVGTIANDYNTEQISRIQVGKQADVLVLFFLLEELFSSEVKKKNFFYYEERTLHDSSLSRSTHSVLAADLGLDDMAYTFFEGAARTDLGPVMTTSDAGIHAASMGGIWQCVVYGFGGVRIVGDRLRLEPHLPKGWQELRFPLCWKGQTFRATVRKDSVKLVTESGESVRPEACGIDVVLSC